MMSGRQLHFCLLALLAVGCDIAKGHGSLANASGFLGFHPPMRVTEGDYAGLQFLQWRTAGVHVIVARHRTGNATTIAVRTFDGSLACDVPGTDFTVAWPVADTDASGEIAVLDDPDDDGVGTLAFYDRSCTQLGASIDSATLPITVPNRDRFLVTAGSRLLAVEPRAASVEVLAEHLQQIDSRVYLARPDAEQVRAFAAWFIDGGQFAALDDDGYVVFRQGEQVTEVADIGDDSVKQFLLDDGGQLRLAPATETIAYAMDVCGLRAVGSDAHGPYVEYRSPCVNGPLRVGQVIGGKFESAVIDSAADSIVAFDGDFTNPSSMFTRPSTSASAGRELWLRVSGAATEKLAGGVAWTAQGYIYRLVDGSLGAHLLALVDANDSSGRLVKFNPDWSWNAPDAGFVNEDRVLLTEAEGVPLTPLMDPYYYQLAHFNGTTGDFVDPFPAGQVIAQGVPADLGAYDTSNSSHTALLANYQSGTGRLGMMASLGAGGVPAAAGPRSIQWLAENVAARSFQFYSELPAIGYLDEWDPTRGAGRFVVHDIDTNIRYTVDEAVREQHSVSWPWVGVIYAIAAGDRQGIWSAREQR